jgi:molecular chaperone GrpE
MNRGSKIPGLESTGEDDVRPANGDELLEVEQLKEDLRRGHDTYLRAMADFDNYRKRVERDRAAAIKAGKIDLILPLLDVVDNFERALQHMDGTPPSVVRGLKAIYRQLVAILEAQGISSFDSLHEKFDPAIHEGVGSIETDRFPPDTVVEEIHRGYRWGKELLRPAQVMVAK